MYLKSRRYSVLKTKPKQTSAEVEATQSNPPPGTLAFCQFCGDSMANDQDMYDGYTFQHHIHDVLPPRGFPRADVHDFAPSTTTPATVADVCSINAQAVLAGKCFEYKS